MDSTLRRAGSLDRFKKAQPHAVNQLSESLVRFESLDGASALPALLSPTVGDFDPHGWLEQNRDRVEAELLRAGAILFRGFGLEDVRAFERFCSILCGDLYGEYGDLPSEGGGEKVYSSTPYPAEKAILFHNESSHQHQWPLRQFFLCLKPAEEGGETPLVDCRLIHQRLDPKILECFRTKGLLYVRNFIENFDVPWQQFFRTNDRAVVESYCREVGSECEWRGPNELTVRQRAPAVLRHPQTGESLFFNQIQLHHVSCLEPEVRASIEALFDEDRWPRNVYYGDGTPIEDSIVQETLGLYWETCRAFPWQPGDVVLVDNMLVAHARKPFRGSRKIVVAMGRMFQAKLAAA